MQHVVGIDEAGRGSLAGPVAVGAVSMSKNLSQKYLKNIKDSKKLPPRQRERWYAWALKARQQGLLDFSVALVSEKVVDKKGLSYAISLGIERNLASLKVSSNSRILLDGSLRAPKKFTNQLTIIKGDEKFPIISLASILAKVTRDRKMVRLSKKFPKFNFHEHKGYGTKQHRLALEKYGSSEIHRQSFLSSFGQKR